MSVLYDGAAGAQGGHHLSLTSTDHVNKLSPTHTQVRTALAHGMTKSYLLKLPTPPECRRLEHSAFKNKSTHTHTLTSECN